MQESQELHVKQNLCSKKHLFYLPVYELRDIETAVREGFRVSQKMSFC